MKTTHPFLALAITANLTLAPFAVGQAVTSATTTSTTTTAGTISELAPDTIVVRTTTDAEPLRYLRTTTTTYVDETGAAVSPELVKSGLPVTVHYVQDGPRLVASRVVVRRATTAVTPAAGGTVTREVTTTTTPPPPPTVVERVVEKPVMVEKRVEVPVEKKVYVDRPVVVEKPVVIEKRVPAPTTLEKTTTTTTTTTPGKVRKVKDEDDD